MEIAAAAAISMGVDVEHSHAMEIAAATTRADCLAAAA
jgi:hypothetical protein